MINLPQIALKEWSSAVEAIADGIQTVIFRKGGIVEPAGDFKTEHDSFYLYPAREHQKPDLIKPEFRYLYESTKTDSARIRIRCAAVVSETLKIQSFDDIPNWATQHIWTDDFIKMRLNYKPEKPLYVIRLTPLLLENPFEFTESLEQAGCKSWVPITLS